MGAWFCSLYREIRYIVVHFFFPEPPLVDSDSVRKQSANSKFNSEGNCKHGGYKSHAVLTAIEPLSLPSVMGSKTNMGLFGSSNNPENVKNQSKLTRDSI